METKIKHFSNVSSYGSKPYTIWVYSLKIYEENLSFFSIHILRNEAYRIIKEYCKHKNYIAFFIRDYKIDSSLKEVDITFDIPTSKKCLEGFLNYNELMKYDCVILQ
jgi:hypothetical protein